MSRFTKTIEKDGKVYDIAYGFDNPLQEYFLQVFDRSLITDNDEGLIVWEGSRMTGKDNGDMAELYEQWQVPEEHIQKVVFDVTF